MTTSTGICRAGPAASSTARGYYSAVLETAKQYMTPDEWGFWMEGKPAQGDILDPFGKVMEHAGAAADGGSPRPA